MPDNDLKSAIESMWKKPVSVKANRYVNRFFDRVQQENKIIAKIEGNYGVYTVSIDVKEKSIRSACSCYVGKDGFCHHCEALAFTFLDNPESFAIRKAQPLSQIKNINSLKSYLPSKTLDSLLAELKAKGITNKDFAEIIGMKPQYLSSIKSCELRNRYYNELGAVKLACLWVLEHINSNK